MKLPVFLSVSKPYTEEQVKFLANFEKFMDNQGFQPRTVGRSDYFIDEPLAGCRMVLLESYGLVTVAFRRYYVAEGWENYGCQDEQKSIGDTYLTSPWCHIEAAMAYQLGLPILIFREEGVSTRGLLGKGITDTYMPVFSASEFETYFDRDDFRQWFYQWGGRVRRVREIKGTPPKLYQK